MNQNEFKIDRHKHAFVGIDPSLKSTGLVILDENKNIMYQDVYKTDSECYINSEQYILDVFNNIKFIRNIPRLEYVYIEGLSFMSNSPTLHERIGLFFIIKTFLFSKNIKYKEIPPTKLKKWTTTDGFADKKLMMNVAKCRWNVSFEDDNICDAYCLAMLALNDFLKETINNENV